MGILNGIHYIRGRRQHVFVPGTGPFPNSTCIRTNQSSEGIRYSAVLTEIIRRQRRNTRTIWQQRSSNQIKSNQVYLYTAYFENDSGVFTVRKQYKNKIKK